MRDSIKLAAAAAVAALGLTAAATPASAAVNLLQPSCNVYDLSTGCLFSWSSGGDFDDPVAIVNAYNIGTLAYPDHEPTPVPENLPTLTFLSKVENDPDGVNNDESSWDFSGLATPVSFFVVKSGDHEEFGKTFILFGFETPQTTFTATNTQILGKPHPKTGIASAKGISHVTFFGAPTVAVPEPATWAMMIGGFAAVGSMVRRRRTAVAA